MRWWGGEKKKTLTYFPAPPASRYLPGEDAVTSCGSKERCARRPSPSCPAGAGSHHGEALSHFSATEIPFFPHGLGRASSPRSSEDGCKSLGLFFWLRFLTLEQFGSSVARFRVLAGTASVTGHRGDKLLKMDL